MATKPDLNVLCRWTCFPSLILPKIDELVDHWETRRAEMDQAAD